MDRPNLRAVATIGTLALLVACGGDPAVETTDGSGAAAAESVDLPGTEDAAELWAFLQGADYRSWARWPGTVERYSGGEPHGSTLTTYVNGAAAEALAGGAASLPPGAIVVKENYMPDGELGAVTTMYKVEGYNPAAGDWHWVKFLPDGSVDNEGMAQGRVQGCIACHTGRADNDYIFTSELGG